MVKRFFLLPKRLGDFVPVSSQWFYVLRTDPSSQRLLVAAGLGALASLLVLAFSRKSSSSRSAECQMLLDALDEIARRSLGRKIWKMRGDEVNLGLEDHWRMVRHFGMTWWGIFEGYHASWLSAWIGRFQLPVIDFPSPPAELHQMTFCSIWFPTVAPTVYQMIKCKKQPYTWALVPSGTQVLAIRHQHRRSNGPPGSSRSFKTWLALPRRFAARWRRPVHTGFSLPQEWKSWIWSWRSISLFIFFLSNLTMCCCYWHDFRNDRI